MIGDSHSAVARAARSERPKAPEIESAVLSDGGTSSLDGMAETNELLRALLAVTGRVAFPEEQLRGIISPMGNAAYLEAYRLCDGKTPASAIAKTTGIDQGNLSKAITKWIELGVAFRSGPKRLPLHLYALATDGAKSAVSKRGGSSADVARDERQVEPAVEPSAPVSDSKSGHETGQLQLSAES